MFLGTQRLYGVLTIRRGISYSEPRRRISVEEAKTDRKYFARVIVTPRGVLAGRHP